VRFFLAFVVAAGCAPVRPPAREVGDVHSNILYADYAGSEPCRKCHREIWDAWSGSPMHKMTRIVVQATGGAPFDGSELRFKDDRAVMEKHGGKRYVRVESPRFGNHLFRVTRVIGGHHREDFAGVEVASPGGDATSAERVLPVSFMLATKSWRYKGYSVFSPERPGLKAGAIWQKTCIFCHNTVPYLSTILQELAGPGTPPYQGEVVDRLLPAEKRRPFRILDEKKLSKALAAELERLDAPGQATPRELVDATRARFSPKHLVEVGIGCESCHGGSRAHVDNFNLSPTFEVKSPFLRQEEPAGAGPKELRAQRINRVCARCHQVLFSRYPFTWEGGLRARDPGGSNINSGEARDFLLGGCASAMSCADCHDPHVPDNRARMDSLEGAPGNRVCVRCHTKYDNVIAVEAHSHHKADGAGGVCMNCHMPKKNMSLDSRLTRYHRIGSPTDRARVEGDRPLECALCHGQKTVAQLVEQMEAWWQKRYDRAALVRLYGSLETRPLTQALIGGKAHEQATALGALTTQTDVSLAPLVAVQLTHPYPILRYYAAKALEALVGESMPIDLHQENQRIRDQAGAWLARHGVAPIAAPGHAASAGDGDE
jgi:predicted CXXCH cytochrome family protein